MKIAIKVKPNSKEEAVEPVNKNEFILRVRAPAREGRANEAVIELLSEYFSVPQKRVMIIRGHKSKNKVVEIF